MTEFVDCNCTGADKCPQGKTGQRTRCFIPVDKASIGSTPLPDIVAMRAASLLAPADEHFSEVPEALCKGDWMLGTACGTCPRCIETAKPTINTLRLVNQEQLKRLTLIVSCVPLLAPQPGGTDWFDITDEFKVQCFNEIRRALTRSTPQVGPQEDGRNAGT